jgi:hypothetical protein
MGLNEWGKEFLVKCDIPFIQGARRTFKTINSFIEYDKFLNNFKKGKGKFGFENK